LTTKAAASWVKKAGGEKNSQFSHRHEAANFRQEVIIGVQILPQIFPKMGNLKPQIVHFWKTLASRNSDFGNSVSKNRTSVTFSNSSTPTPTITVQYIRKLLYIKKFCYIVLQSAVFKTAQRFSLTSLHAQVSSKYLTSACGIFEVADTPAE